MVEKDLDDGVTVTYDGYAVTLILRDSLDAITDLIILGPETLADFLAFVKETQNAN